MAKLETIDKEKELLAEIAEGNKEAFGELYDFYAPRIFRFIRLKVGSQTLAEDLSSEAFLRIWEYVQAGEIAESFQALLYKIARNLIVDYYKRKSSGEILMDDDFREFLEKKVAKDEVFSREQAAEIHTALVNIKEEYQDVIIWYYVDELPVAEICRIMDKSHGAIRVLLHRALKALRRELEKLD